MRAKKVIVGVAISANVNFLRNSSNGIFCYKRE